MKRLVLMLTALMLAALMAFSFTACSRAQAVTVGVSDQGRMKVIEGTDDMTVQELLEAGGYTIGPRDEVAPPLSTVWKEANAASITIRRYAKVTVTDGETQKEIELMDGTVGEAIAQAGYDTAVFLYDGDPNALLTDGMTITLTPQRDGFVTEGANTYYYVQGVKQTSAVVGDETEGYFYANEEGVIDKGYCDGVNVNGQDWIVINGAATPVVTESDKTLFLAAQDIAKCTTSTMTKDEKLKAAFDYIRENYLEGVPHDPPYREADWPIVCANDLFVYGKGDCYSYGAAFAYMAKAIGCSDVYACNSGGHGWAEAEGKMYDPEWSMHSDKYSYFAVGPDDEVDVAYWTTVNDAEWKHKEIKLNQVFE